MSIKLAVVGATGAVGREMLNVLAERETPVAELHALASRNSIGSEVSFGDRTLKAEAIEHFDFRKVDVALFAAGGDVAREWAPKVAKSGVIVVDNSSAFRMNSDIPLIVPEVNADAVDMARRNKIIANPNCSTAQLVVALKPLHDAARIKRVVVSTYQSTSGAGSAAMDELFQQTRAIFVNDPIEPRQFTKQIAFNVIPHIDEFMEDGSTREEWKMVAETKKILDPNIRVTATCVRVPVFVGHAESVNIEFENPLSDEEAREILRESPGVLVVDKREDGGYVTPVECAGDYATFVSRIRTDPTIANGLNMWIVSDNLRKGAALNAVQIVELMLDRGVLAARP
ncbi:MAG: aspartate-semialdehyde dehydrogenase [Parvularculaceae bacterium]